MKILDTTTTVTIETTPNPQTLKFKFSESLVSKPFDCPNAQEAEKSPLAAKIFGFPWTDAVYLGQDFVSVTKQDWVDWEILAQPLATLIQTHIQSGEELVIEIPDAEDLESGDSEVVNAIKRALHTEIRPIVAYDGGDIEFVKYENQRLHLKFKGACAGCPSKSVTLKQGIEVRLKELFPEIIEVFGA